MSRQQAAMRSLSAVCLVATWGAGAGGGPVTWAGPARVAAPASIGRFALAATTGSDGRIYALGGTDGVAVGQAEATRGLKTVDAYLPSTGQ